MKKTDAQSRTVPLFGDQAPTEVPVERVKTRPTQDDIDAPMMMWVNSDITDPSYSVRIAKYKNGHRGLQFMRKDATGKVFNMSCVLLTPQMYKQLRDCIMKDLKLITERP